MKALSIKQPWAWLICAGWKNVENRDWYTHFRGRVLVHAGKTFDQAGYEWVMRNSAKLALELVSLPRPDEYPRGGIVGIAKITDCVSEMDSPWFVGKYGFRIDDSVPIPTIPLPGQLGFFNVPEVVAQMAREYGAQYERARRAVHSSN